MEELFETDKMKSIKKEETLAKFPVYSPEAYLNDLIKLFNRIAEIKNAGNTFKLFCKTDNRANEKTNNIPFVKEIRKFNLSYKEKFYLLYLYLYNFTNGKGGIHCYHNSFSREKIFEIFSRFGFDDALTLINLVYNPESIFYASKLLIYNEREHFENIRLNENIRNSLLCIKTKKSVKKPAGTKIMKPAEIYRELKSYVIGQDAALKNISSAVYEHLIKCRLNGKNKKDKLDKTNILLIGSTGTGKTYICNTLSKILDIPVYTADASQLTSSGYVGVSVYDIFKGLKRNIKNMEGNKFPPSIIYIDEADKTAFGDTKNDIGTKCIQEELLKALESSTYNVSDKSSYDNDCCEYDISNIMFIVGGAFSGIKDIITERTGGKTKEVGFFKQNSLFNNDTENILNKVTVEDLIKYGMMPELMGRLQNITVLNELTKKDLINILTSSKNNVIEQYKQIFAQAGTELKILDETVDYIAQQAINNKTGARGLKNILSRALNDILFEATDSNKKDFVLTKDILRYGQRN